MEHLEEQCAQELFSAWSLADNKYAVSAYWADECQISRKNVSQFKSRCLHPYFDLSSLTKPIFLNLYLRFIFKNDYLKLISTPLNDMFLPNNCIAENDELLKFLLNHENNYNINSFLSHYSGAKNWFWMGNAKWLRPQNAHLEGTEIYNNLLDINDKDYISKVKINLNNICIKSIYEKQYSEVVYSDVNYYVLARIIESYFMKNNSWSDILNLLNENLMTKFYHASLTPSESEKSIPFYPYISYYGDDFTNCKSFNKFGYISDTNANILSSLQGNAGIVSGHTGLFGTVCDVKNATEELCKTQKKYTELINYVPDKNVRFVYGMDTPTGKESTAAVKHWVQNRSSIYGHLGYSGTSFWFSVGELKNQTNQHILLTNRLAKRKKYGSEICPRFYIITDFINNYNKVFVKIKDSITEVSESDLLSMNSEYFGISKKIWDNSIINIPRNINDIRRTIGFNLWDL